MFVTLKRAPLGLVDDLAGIPGVARVTARVVQDVALDIPGRLSPDPGGWSGMGLVDMAAVQTGPLRVTIDEEGMTRVRDRYVVSAPVAGRLERVELRPGDPVVAGDTVLATFLPSTPPLLDTRTRAEAAARTKAAQAAREQARVALQRARDDAAFSANELERQKQVSEFGGITGERLAAHELDARTKVAQVRSAELALQRSEYELEAARAILRQIRRAVSPGQRRDTAAPAD